MGKKQKKTKSQTIIGVRKSTVIFTISAALLILVANSALWANRYIFNSENFSDTVATSLSSESSRSAVASGITDRIFEERPVLYAVAGNTTEKLISGLLATEQFVSVNKAVAGKLHVLATTDSQEAVVVDLTAAKSVIAKLSDISSSRDREPTIKTDDIPDKIVLVEENTIPNIYPVAIVLLWLSPVAFIAAATLLTLPYIRHRKEYKLTLLFQGIVISIAGIAALSIGPLFRPILISNIDKVHARTVITDLFNAFMSTFSQQTSYIVVIGMILVAVASALYGYDFHKNSAKKTLKAKK